MERDRKGTFRQYASRKRTGMGYVRHGLGMSLTLLKGIPLRVTNVKGTRVRQERRTRKGRERDRKGKHSPCRTESVVVAIR